MLFLEYGGKYLYGVALTLRDKLRFKTVKLAVNDIREAKLTWSHFVRQHPVRKRNHKGTGFPYTVGRIELDGCIWIIDQQYVEVGNCFERFRVRVLFLNKDDFLTLLSRRQRKCKNPTQCNCWSANHCCISLVVKTCGYVDQQHCHPEPATHLRGCRLTCSLDLQHTPSAIGASTGQAVSACVILKPFVENWPTVCAHNCLETNVRFSEKEVVRRDLAPHLRCCHAHSSVASNSWCPLL